MIVNRLRQSQSLLDWLSTINLGCRQTELRLSYVELPLSTAIGDYRQLSCTQPSALPVSAVDSATLAVDYPGSLDSKNNIFEICLKIKINTYKFYNNKFFQNV